MRTTILLLLSMLAIGLPQRTAAAPDRPVVIIPGILGSKLCTLDDQVVWGGVDSLFEFHKLKLPAPFDATRVTHKPCGLIEHVQIVGPFKIHQYDDLMTFLTGRGYNERPPAQRTLYAFAYDWRASNLQSALKLKDYVDKEFPNRTQKVDLVAHSMGGLVARIYIQSLGGSDRVHSLVMMGTPHRGSANVFKTLDEGWGFWRNLAAGGIPTIRETMLSFPSVYQLLPSYPNCCGWKDQQGRITYFDSTDEAAWKRFSWLPAELNSSSGRQALATYLDEARTIHRLMQAQMPATVRTANIVTGLIDTQWKTFFDPNTGKFNGTTDFAGDGTVMEWSAANGAPSEARPSTMEHSRIFYGEVPRTVIRWLLGSDSAPTKGMPIDIRARLLDAKGETYDLTSMRYAVEPQVAAPGSPVELSLTLLGRRELASADLRNIKVTLAPDGPAASTTLGASVSVGDFVQRDLTAVFAAPQRPGSHSVLLDIPGVGEFNDVVVVLK